MLCALYIIEPLPPLKEIEMAIKLWKKNVMMKMLLSTRAYSYSMKQMGEGGPNIIPIITTIIIIMAMAVGRIGGGQGEY